MFLQQLCEQAVGFFVAAEALALHCLLERTERLHKARIVARILYRQAARFHGDAFFRRCVFSAFGDRYRTD
jgi:hypothetical protein